MTIDKTQYREDAKGNLVPLANIREIDLLRDELVTEIASKACVIDPLDPRPGRTQETSGTAPERTRRRKLHQA